MKATMICPQCGTAGRPKTYTKGSMAIELLAWLCFLIPGLFYSIWRWTSRYRGCPHCGADHMVPLASPRGKKLVAEFAPSPPLTG